MKIKFLISIIIICILSILFYFYYENSLNDSLYCNRDFNKLDGVFIDEVAKDVNYKFYTWESEMFDCHHNSSYIKRILYFVNDSTAIICTKSVPKAMVQFFTINYLFNNIQFLNKDYRFYNVKGDSLSQYHYKPPDLLPEGKIPYYLKEDAELEIIDAPEVIFTPYKEFATISTKDDILKLTYFNRVYLE